MTLVRVRWRVAFTGDPRRIPRESFLPYKKLLRYVLKEVPGTVDSFKEVAAMRRMMIDRGISSLTFADAEKALRARGCDNSLISLVGACSDVFDITHRDMQLYILSKMGVDSKILGDVLKGR